MKKYAALLMCSVSFSYTMNSRSIERVSSISSIEATPQEEDDFTTQYIWDAAEILTLLRSKKLIYGNDKAKIEKYLASLIANQAEHRKVIRKGSMSSELGRSGSFSPSSSISTDTPPYPSPPYPTKDKD